jgi:hypothetical protein
MCTGTSSESTSLSALLAGAHRRLAIGDPTDEYLAVLAAAFRAAADAHPAERRRCASSRPRSTT